MTSKINGLPRFRANDFLFAALCAATFALTGCGGGGGGGGGGGSSTTGGGGGTGTSSYDVVEGQVSTSSGPVGSGYVIVYDSSSSLKATTNSSGVYSLSVPVSAITGSDSLSVEQYPPTVEAIQPVTTALSASGGATVTQNIEITGTPPYPPSI